MIFLAFSPTLVAIYLFSFISVNGNLLVKSSSNPAIRGVPSSAGVPQSIAEHTLSSDFNNLEQTARLFEMYKDDIAAIIVEPIAGNMGMVLPQPHFLQGLRALCDSYNAVLIFDEVMTGFRVALGGAQSVYGVTPDLTTLGKVIGGGMPVGALGGKASIMDYLAPTGPVYQAGTLSGNPLAMAAGLATLTELETPGFYDHLTNMSGSLIQALTDVMDSMHIPFCGTSMGGMFGYCFTDKSFIVDYDDVAAADEALFKRFFHGMLDNGVYFAPSMFESGFVSGAHEPNDIVLTQRAAEIVLRTIVKA